MVDLPATQSYEPISYNESVGIYTLLVLWRNPAGTVLVPRALDLLEGQGRYLHGLTLPPTSQPPVCADPTLSLRGLFHSPLSDLVLSTLVVAEPAFH